MITARTKQILQDTMTDIPAADEIVDTANSASTGALTGSAPAQITAPSTPPAFTATSGSLPAPNGATVFANTATPTVVELLDAVVELQAIQVSQNAKIALIIAGLHSRGVTL